MNPSGSQPPPGPSPPPPAFDLERALEGLVGRRTVAVYMHDNPDPDCLAAALGLGALLEHELRATVTLVLGGIVGRAENRAMVEALAISLTPVEALGTRTFDCIAIVDSQPGTGNNSLPAGCVPDIVVDHHLPRGNMCRSAWCDVRPNLGATSTIVLQYLRERGVPLTPALATGLFYALRSETRDLGREATEAERAAYLHLVPLVDHQLLYRVSHPKVPREHFIALDRALRLAQVHGDLVAVNLDELFYPDLVAEIADLLLAYENARFVLCGGRYQGRVYVSLRTDPGFARAGGLMRQIIDSLGGAGGHGTMAGARLTWPVTSAEDLAQVFAILVTRLHVALGRTESSPVPLIGS